MKKPVYPTIAIKNLVHEFTLSDIRQIVVTVTKEALLYSDEEINLILNLLEDRKAELLSPIKRVKRFK